MKLRICSSRISVHRTLAAMTCIAHDGESEVTCEKDTAGVVKFKLVEVQQSEPGKRTDPSLRPPL